MAWNDNLAGPALRVAAVRASPLRVRAGPGTGKTFALMRRLARLRAAPGVAAAGERGPGRRPETGPGAYARAGRPLLPHDRPQFGDGTPSLTGGIS